MNSLKLAATSQSTQASTAANIFSGVQTESANANPAFIQSDWEFELDIMVSPTLTQLTSHLSKLPTSEQDSDAAIYLKNYINELSIAQSVN